MKTVIHYYDFWLDSEEARTQYQKLTDELKAKGLVLFECVSKDYEYMQKIKALDGKEVELDLSFLFDNQWNTTPVEGISSIGLRIHDWYERIVPNHKRKDGYWIEISDEMKALRADTFRCGYCAAKYHRPKFEWCDSCISDRYLKQDNLSSLYLLPLSIRDREAREIRRKQTVPKTLVDAYISANTEMLRKYSEDRHHSRLADIQAKMRAIDVEYEIYKTLIESKVLTETQIDIDNIIYYSHSQQVCFGWRDKLSDEKRKALLVRLDEIGFTTKYVVTFK